MILNSKVLRLAISGAITLIFTSIAQPRDLDWGGSVFATNLRSDGTTPLDGSFVFYLGYFEGFTPTPDNTDEWAEHWQSVDAVNYKPAYGLFNARHRVTSSIPGNPQGYIWGIRRTRENMEWILITDPSWTFPSPDQFGRKINWMVGSASEAVLGQINGADYQMVTAPAGDTDPIPAISYETWVKRFFADGDADADPNADPNGNNLSNIIEFALDADPNAGQANRRIQPSVYPSESAAGRYLGVIVQPSLDADVEVLGWVSPDVTFTTDVTAAEIETLSDGSLLIRDPSPLGPANPRKFIRVEFREPSS